MRVAWVGFAVACVAVVVLTVFARRSAAERAEAERRAAEAVVAARVMEVFERSNVSLPAGTRVVQSLDRSARDRHLWGLLEMPGGDVAAVRDAVVRANRKAERPIRLPAEPGEIPRRDTAPEWWRPEACGDAEVFIVGWPDGWCTVFAFSASRGRVYVLDFNV